MGQGATAGHSKATAIGQGAASTEANQVVLGTATEHVDALGAFSSGVIGETYSTSITPDSATGNYRKIIATDTVAFAINAPTHAKTGRHLVFDIKNSSGGSMGAITWNAVFLLAGAFSNPANGKRRTISFYYDGTNWVELNRAAADI